MEAVEYQARIEALTEDILTDRQLSSEYNRKFHENTLAQSKLRDQMKKIHPTSQRYTIAVNMGDFFMQIPLPKAQSMVNGAQKELESAIQEVQQRLEKKVDFLEQLKKGDKA
ncbi:hypothetical protein H4R99_005474 [Coemansia sp. RSA 1722]|nr:hypothetical protein LPJ57_006092 [Coemansia sp. RSA 486]KAJ2236116.1 hypothetical protein IWW45_002037 [Coemansia sp. RSA 485]KAJ2595146.1 hypothetical protein H4R99_005474 [Coemansia sp. RSA 1722]